MDYLQYFVEHGHKIGNSFLGFKPYYKWITFNTKIGGYIGGWLDAEVLNLIINGLPSILKNENNKRNSK